MTLAISSGFLLIWTSNFLNVRTGDPLITLSYCISDITPILLTLLFRFGILDKEIAEHKYYDTKQKHDYEQLLLKSKHCRSCRISGAVVQRMLVSVWFKTTNLTLLHKHINHINAIPLELFLKVIKVGSKNLNQHFRNMFILAFSALLF